MAFLGKKLVNLTGEVLSSSLNLSNPLLVYFSASWCPPCRSFTPKLIEFYNTHKKTNKDLEVVLVSLDETEAAFSAYSSKMPWLSIPFTEKKTIESLGVRYSMTSIPLLVLVNKNGDLLNSECRHVVEGNPSKAYDLFVKLLKDDEKKVKT